MKKLLLASAIAFFGVANAQQVNFGANAGMLTGFATLKTPMGDESNNNTGFYAGIFATILPGHATVQYCAIRFVRSVFHSCLYRSP